MRSTMRFGLSALMLATAAGASAQSNGGPSQTSADTGTKKEGPAKVSLYRPLDINHIRPADSRGVNVFGLTPQISGSREPFVVHVLHVPFVYLAANVLLPSTSGVRTSKFVSEVVQPPEPAVH